MMSADTLAYYYLRNPLPVEMTLPKPLIPPPWRVEILASDISYSVLRTGQEGFYNEHQMRQSITASACVTSIRPAIAIPSRKR